MLYTFKKLSQHLTELGYPQAGESSFRIIKKDLTQEQKAGNIRFGEDGIYLNVDGTEYKGYMYHKFPDISQYGFPKFHITNCTTILDQKAQGRFDTYYFWHNSNNVTLEDRTTGKTHENITLKLCGNCKKLIRIEYNDTQGFFDTLDTQEINQNVEVDILGYTLDWQRGSRAYRIEKDYTCESCGIKIDEPIDRRFIHVHHRNGNKLNNNPSNLECLCVLCHSQKDATHERNFGKRKMQAKIRAFIKKYETKLKELNNPYVDMLNRNI